MNNWFKRFLNYLKKNPGSGFVLGFIVLLVGCAFLLIFKQERLAEHLANWAYSFLVIGVIIKFVRMIRERK